MSDDGWDRWFRKRRWRWPFFFFSDKDEDGFFFSEVFREIEEMMEREFQNIIRERKLPDGSRPFVYGYSITIGPDGKPQIREFGNVKPEAKLGRPKISIKEEREPLVDVIPANGEVKVIAELPGVEKKDIKLRGTEKTLTISVDTPQHKYYKEVKLTAKVDPAKAKSSYKNGVLEVTLPKKEEEKPKGEPIEIE